METTHDSSPMAAEVDIALGQDPEHLGVVSHLDVAQARSPKGRHRDRVSIVGVVLVGTTGREYSNARGKGGRDVEHLFTPCHELLGQQVAHPAGRLDGPPPLLEGLGPAHELFDLTTGGTHLDAGDLAFSLVDGHRRVRCLVGVDPDHHLHEYLLGCCEPRGHSCLRMFVLDPLLSHSVGEAPMGRSSNESHPTEAGGRHYESEPTRTPQRYGLAITSASSLKQAHRGYPSWSPRSPEDECPGSPCDDETRS